jgi:hypothetical protein
MRTPAAGSDKHGYRKQPDVRFTPEADIRQRKTNVRYGPKADMPSCTAHVRYRG